MIEALV
jgi:hypothetical protein